MTAASPSSIQIQGRLAKAAGLAFCLGLPFVLRLLVSWAFYGCTDTQNFLSAMGALLQGHEKLFNYYPPSVFPEALGALGGLLTPVPMTALFKMSNALPDLFLAGWFFARLVHANGGRPSTRIYLLTFLLHLAPSLLIVSHLHGQMDSWSIFFIVLAAECFVRTKPAWAFAAGLSLIFSIGIKIFPLFVLPCFYLWRPWRPRHLLLFTAGLGVGYLLYFSHYLWEPQHILAITTNALGYQSEPLLGIKGLIWPYLEKLPGGPPSLRTFIVGGLFFSYLVAWARRLDLHHALLLTLLAAITFSVHLTPQYLLWPTVLLFWIGMYRAAVFYNLTAGALLISYYYYTPGNSGTYAPLISLAALAPLEPHWLTGHPALLFFNDLLRGAGIWLAIFAALISVGVFTRCRAAQAKNKTTTVCGNLDSFPAAIWLWGGMALLAVGYSFTLFVTGTAGYRKNLGASLRPTFYQRNYFGYGQNYLHEITLQLPEDQAPPAGPLLFSFSGNDFYAVFQNGVPFERPLVSRTYLANHAGFVEYTPVVHTIATSSVEALPTGRRLTFWILDGSGSLNDYRAPSFIFEPSDDDAPPELPVTITSARLTQRQLDGLFGLWVKSGQLPPDLAVRLGISLEPLHSAAGHDWALHPAASVQTTPFSQFSVIEGLFLFLGFWTALGLFLTLQKRRGFSWIDERSMQPDG